jgi:hypothetical protein
MPSAKQHQYVVFRIDLNEQLRTILNAFRLNVPTKGFLVVISKTQVLDHQQLGAGKWNRTLIASLEGWSFTIKLCRH